MKPKLDTKDIITLGGICVALVAFGWKYAERFTRLEERVSRNTAILEELRVDIKTFKHDAVPGAVAALQDQINALRKETGKNLSEKYE